MSPSGGGWLLAGTPPESVFTPEDFTPQQRQPARAAQDFMEEEVLPQSDAIERQEPGLARRLLGLAGERGLLAVDVPREYGGLGADLVSACLALEQFSRQASFAVAHGAHAGIGTLPPLYFGSEEQKRRYLPRLARGELVGAFALTEEGSGSDALNAAARAVASPGGYRLTGEKMWISNAGIADLFTVFAQLEGAGPGGEPALTAFLVERNFPGVNVGPDEPKMGIRGATTCRVFLENTPVPAGNLLHEAGRGHVVALNVLNAGRLKLAAGLLGPARELLGLSARHANRRQQMGRPIARFGLIRQKLAEQAVRLYAAESAVYRVCGMVQGYDDGPRTVEDQPRRSDEPGESSIVHGQPGIADRRPPIVHRQPSADAFEEHLVECAILKIFSSEMLGFVADEAVQIHGGLGYSEALPVARAYRDARINRIFEGTNEINRLTVAATLMRRAERGRLPLFEAAAQADLAANEFRAAPAGPLAAEMAALEGARRRALALMGAAWTRFGDRIAEEQEVLGCLADVVTLLFVAESAALRAAKMGCAGTSVRGDLAAVMSRLFVSEALDRIAFMGRTVLAGHDGEEEPEGPVSLQPPPDVIRLRRSVADAVSECEGYPLSRS